MILSEAIRLGSMLHPQAFGKLWCERRDGLFGPYIRESTCALGAAFEAVGGYEARDFTPWSLFSVSAACPQCGVEATVSNQITHLNDDHRWTRERIADFIEELEQQQNSRYVEAQGAEVTTG